MQKHNEQHFYFKYALQTPWVSMCINSLCVHTYTYTCTYTCMFREEGFSLLLDITDWKNYANSCSAELTY